VLTGCSPWCSISGCHLGKLTHSHMPPLLNSPFEASGGLRKFTDTQERDPRTRKYGARRLTPATTPPTLQWQQLALQK
jgi:hypothetical protein